MIAIGKGLRTAASAALVLVSLGTAEAQAQSSCLALSGQLADLGQRAASLALDNPGSTTVFGSCLAVGADNYNSSHDETAALAAFAVCAGLACVTTDNYQNCLSVGTQLFLMALRATVIQDQMKSQRCG